MLKSKLSSKNMIDGINSWAVEVIQYIASIIDWTTQDIKRKDIRTQKIMAINGALHPRSKI